MHKHTHIHTYAHTYTHVYKYTHIHILYAFRLQKASLGLQRRRRVQITGWAMRTFEGRP